MMPLVTTNRGPLVLLFYDGYEWRARDGLLAGAQAQSRRVARFVYRTVRRKQVHTGFYTAFLALRTALERHGCDVRVNDFAETKARPDYPIGLAGYPSVLEAVQLPNPVVFGPGDFGAPDRASEVAADPRMKVLIQPSDWFRDYYRPSCGDKVVTWFAGIDTQAWPDLSEHRKTIDVLIYDKIRWNQDRMIPAVCDRLVRHLAERGRSCKILRYGHHHRAEFAASLAQARTMAFLCEHETQGLAYQEALASGVPVFAWDEGKFIDPMLAPAAPVNLDVSAVPYFDERCGRRFHVDHIETEFDTFWSERARYSPRSYVCENLSMQRSAEAYLELYARAGGSSIV